MNRFTLISIPSLVRIKPGALARLGIYLERARHARIVVLASEGLPESVRSVVHQSLIEHAIDIADWKDIQDNRFEYAGVTFRDLPGRVSAIVGLGGGKALDVAKYVAFLARLPYYAVPTSLSNDGFCSPQSSLTVGGKRRSLAAALPHGVVIDVEVCLAAPRVLWLSGVGDLAAKLTAVFDWKLAFHHTGELVDDFAALLSEATVSQFLSRPEHDLPSTTLLGTALMLNGIAMEVCGSSRPASGSEHLISHALDALSARPRRTWSVNFRDNRRRKSPRCSTEPASGKRSPATRSPAANGWMPCGSLPRSRSIISLYCRCAIVCRRLKESSRRIAGCRRVLWIRTNRQEFCLRVLFDAFTPTGLCLIAQGCPLWGYPGLMSVVIDQPCKGCAIAS